jgi:Ni,Fe-hydrogenase I small subunit
MWCEWCWAGEERFVPRQRDRPCPRCTFTGFWDGVPTFVNQPYLSLTVEATVAARNFAQAVIEAEEKRHGQR